MHHELSKIYTHKSVATIIISLMSFAIYAQQHEPVKTSFSTGTGEYGIILTQLEKCMMNALFTHISPTINQDLI